jgi:environmental stress-induced protein Ves
MRKVLSSSHYVKKPWKNGQGTTQEIIAWPSGTEDYLWRLSMADLKESGAFSLFPDHNRILVLIDGEAVGLDQAGNYIELPLMTPHTFDGSINTYAYVKTPGRDFNLILKKGHASGKITAGRGKKEIVVTSRFLAVFKLDDFSTLIWEDEIGSAVTIEGPGSHLLIEIDA